MTSTAGNRWHGAMPPRFRCLCRSVPIALAILIALLALAFMAVISSPANAASKPLLTAPNQILVHRKFKLDIRDGEIVADIRTIRVIQGEAVEIMWTSDQRTKLHLHGYNILIKVKPNHPASMSFLAKTAGRFSIAAHMFGHGTVIVLEVYPK